LRGSIRSFGSKSWPIANVVLPHRVTRYWVICNAPEVIVSSLSVMHMHASVLEPANPCIFTLMVRKRSNWCGAFGRLVVKHLLVAGQKRPWIAVFAPLRSDFRAMDAHFECPAVHHLLYGALAAMDDFRKATPFVTYQSTRESMILSLKSRPPQTMTRKVLEFRSRRTPPVCRRSSHATSQALLA